jgi:E3 ubiquitin-protein ligase NRDP1
VIFFLRCENADFGCSSVVKLDLMCGHLKECQFNPKRPVPCSLGCGLTVPKDEASAAG